jgi:addiction module HigA family antidote
MAPVVHSGRLLKREPTARKLSANRLSLDIGMPSGRVTGILNGRRSMTADTAVRLGRYFGNGAQFWLDLQGHMISASEREKGAEIAREARRRSVARTTVVLGGYAALFRPTNSALRCRGGVSTKRGCRHRVGPSY